MPRLKSWMLTGFIFLLPQITVAKEVVAKVGNAAPTFSAEDADGKTQKLEVYKGKYVVLEWYNKDCPFVRKHYDVGNMQGLQRTYTEKGVIWFQVVTSAKGKQGYLTGAQAKEQYTKEKAAATATLLDPKGQLGKLYAAKTTPHMFIIDPKGTLIYAGAIDDKASTDSADIKTSTNYVRVALDAALAGQPVPEKIASNKSYGCSVKYE